MYFEGCSIIDLLNWHLFYALSAAYTDTQWGYILFKNAIFNSFFQLSNCLLHYFQIFSPADSAARRQSQSLYHCVEGQMIEKFALSVLYVKHLNINNT